MHILGFAGGSCRRAGDVPASCRLQNVLHLQAGWPSTCSGLLHWMGETHRQIQEIIIITDCWEWTHSPSQFLWLSAQTLPRRWVCTSAEWMLRAIDMFSVQRVEKSSGAHSGGLPPPAHDGHPSTETLIVEFYHNSMYSHGNTRGLSTARLAFKASFFQHFCIL